MSSLRALTFAIALLAMAALPVAGGAAPVDPDVALEFYNAALQTLVAPPIESFEFRVEQAGPDHNLSEAHRVYRQGSLERDETLMDGGGRLSPPSVRIHRKAKDRYALAQLAPRDDRYVFAFVSRRKDGHHYDYVYRVLAKSGGPFEVTGMILDGIHFLPISISFVTTQGKVRSSGTVTFAQAEKYWVVREAVAVAHLDDADETRERISFSSYHFPSALPPSTFGRPKPLSLGPLIVLK
mgnify:CR=1 FL=1